jgi:uncharacterized membrane protein YedE/YeeE
MFETFGFETLTPRGASLWLGVGIGLIFGVLAEATRFCLRRVIAGEMSERLPAGALWGLALAVALAGTQGAVAFGWIDFAEHRFHASDLPVLALVSGGVLFGAGMVLARGCAARLSVLAASGNLRAAAVILVMATVAAATMRGIFSPLRQALSTLTLPAPDLSILALPATIMTMALAIWAVRRAALPLGQIAAGIIIGLLVPLAWVGTGFVLQDAFDPIPTEALSFVAPAADSLYYIMAASALAPGFGVALLAGVLMGAMLSALRAGRARWQSFATPRETGRYALGAVFMGFGGVLAGGCTIGAGLSGVPTLSAHALITLAAILGGAWAAQRGLNASFSGSGAPSARPA